MALTDWIFENLPLIGFIVIIVAMVLYFMFKEKKEAIENRVELFFKGGTKEIFPCVVERNTVRFKVGETEFNEPILHHPRINYDRERSKVFRDYLYAEGLGMVDVPPLTDSDKKDIVEYLIQNGVIPEAEKEANIKDYSDETLMKYIKFYNFDIEQITDKPMANAFIMTINMFSSMVTSMINNIGHMEGKGTSNLAKLMYVIIGVFIGFGFAWALTLKKVI